MKQAIVFLWIGFAGTNIIAQTNTFPSSGNVGIGTMSPANTLHVVGGVSAGDSKFYNSVQLTGSINGSTQSWIWAGATNQLHLGVGSVSSPNTKMVIDNTGNVGIGTAIPAGRIDVQTDGLTVGSFQGTSIGSYANTLFKSNTATLNININSGTRTGNVYSSSIPLANAMILDGGATNGALVLTNGTTQPIAFVTNSNERMRIDGYGNVGIGISSPSEKLSVKGNVKAQKVIVTQTGWSDYVFNKDYRLRSLQDLETFINQYKHLPEVPTAMEVAAKGISVGDNQALLLKKIEELTLYIIDIKKENERLRERIEKVEKRK